MTPSYQRNGLDNELEAVDLAGINNPAGPHRTCCDWHAGKEAR